MEGQFGTFTQSFNHVAVRAHWNSKNHGFWPEYDPTRMVSIDTVGLKLSLIHSEISEALEAARDGYPSSKKIDTGQFEEELADAVIRIMDLGVAMGVDVGQAVTEKMSYNLGRPHKHGGKSA